MTGVVPAAVQFVAELAQGRREGRAEIDAEIDGPAAAAGTPELVLGGGEKRSAET